MTRKILSILVAEVPDRTGYTMAQKLRWHDGQS